jgi:hypothetical protein
MSLMRQAAFGSFTFEIIYPFTQTYYLALSTQILYVIEQLSEYDDVNSSS